MHQTVRRLAINDVGVVADLERAARAGLEGERGGAAHLSEREAIGDWRPLVDNDDRPVWVGAIDEVVVGYLELAVAAVATVMQVYVEPLAREVGFGDWLLEAAIEFARVSGCSAIEGFALPGDRATKNLYERAGITARRITVSKSLD